MIYAKQVAPKKALARAAGGKLISLGFGTAAFKNYSPSTKLTFLPPFVLGTETSYSSVYAYFFGTYSGAFQNLCAFNSGSFTAKLVRITGQTEREYFTGFFECLFSFDIIASFSLSLTDKAWRGGGFVLPSGVVQLAISSETPFCLANGENAFVELRS